MKEPVIERVKLWHTLFERKRSDTMIDAIMQIIERTRIEQGHTKAEEKAKEIRGLIETGISEPEL